jgi:hypothetical protein
MIRWCSYCQAFLGEKAPFDSPALSDGICAACDARLDTDEKLVEKTAAVRDLMNRVFDCGGRADESAIPDLLAEAAALHLPSDSLLVGLLQPALYRAGEAWQAGGMSVAEEHRFTGWCESFFTQLSVRPPTRPLIDLLIFLAPGNTHTMGPRFMAELLEDRGISAQVCLPELAVAAMVKEIERLRPHAVGLSCALPTSLPAADALLQELSTRVERSWPRCFLLGGFALRGASGTWMSAAGASIAVTPEDVERVVRPWPQLPSATG